jgi:hypothetical protein
VLNASAVFADSDKGIGKIVSLTNSLLEGINAGNYSLSFAGAPTTTASISTKELTISGGFTALNKVYDNSNGASINNVTLTLNGLLPGDDVALTAVAAFPNENVQTGKVVNLTASILTGSKANNYSLSFTGSPTSTANITAKELTVSGALAQDKIFDGNTTATIAGATLVGVIAGDNVTLSNSAAGVFAQATIGTDIAVSTSMTLSGVDAGNYTLTQPSGLKASILVIGQTITLSKGWNILSFNVLPISTDLKAIFQPLITSGELIKVMNESGSTIENIGSWVNEIGNSISTEGYKVKVTQNTTLEVDGSSLTLPLSINLSTGWNIISYPAQNAQNAKDAIQSLINDGKLIKVMDEAGNTIENVGGTWFNEIGNFIPGEGYKVKVTSACTLTINEGVKSAIIVPQRPLASSHFGSIFTGNGFDHMNVYLTDLSVSGIHSGDEIGVFDGKLCVGSVLVSQDQLFNGILNIPVSSNDGLSVIVNGFTTGNTLKLKIYTNGQESLLDFKTLDNTSDQFVPGASVIVKASVGTVTGMDDLFSKTDISCYPNPFAEELTIEINQPAGIKMHVEIFDVMGRKITDLYQGLSTGNDIIKWNGKNGQGTNVRPGVYYIRCNDQVSKGIVKK